jgi:hypothetical protein
MVCTILALLDGEDRSAAPNRLYTTRDLGAAARLGAALAVRSPALAVRGAANDRLLAIKQATSQAIARFFMSVS